MRDPRGFRYGNCPARAGVGNRKPLSADFAAKSSAILRPDLLMIGAV
jgi:hypothetical protein